MTEGFEKVLEGLSTEVALSYASYEPGNLGPGQIEEEVPPNRVSVVLQFCETGFGFGEITLVATPEGTFLDTECMSVERVKGYFALLLDGAITDNDRDPARHLLFNKVMQRQCGRGCDICSPKEPK